MRQIAEAFRPMNEKDVRKAVAATHELNREAASYFPPDCVENSYGTQPERRNRMTHEAASAPAGFPSNTGLPSGEFRPIDDPPGWGFDQTLGII